MGNVLSKEKREQVIALGRLGWSLRRIEQATGVRRETAGDYLRSAGIALRGPGGWGRKAPAKAATAVTTGADSSRQFRGQEDVKKSIWPKSSLIQNVSHSPADRL
jgi:hypothetical protein